MSAQGFESVLARLYADAGFRRRFLAQPEAALAGFPLTCGEQAELIAMDRAGLVMAAQSYHRKRMNRRRPGWAARLLLVIRTRWSGLSG